MQFDNVEVRDGHENLVHLMSLKSAMNTNNVPNHMKAGSCVNHSVPLPVSHWIHSQQTYQEHVKFPIDSSTSLHLVPTDIPEGIRFSLGSINAMNRVTEHPREMLCQNLGRASSSISANSFFASDAWRVKPPVHTINSNETSINIASLLCYEENVIKSGQSCNVPEVRLLRPHNEGETVNKSSSTEYQIVSQNYASWTRESNDSKWTISQPRSRARVSVSGFSSRKRSSLARQRASAVDRRRRVRIAERLEALRGLLPHPIEGSKASLLDDIIDHIRYLKLQIKDLSESRLGGESTSVPFIFLEGYGHYLLHENTVNEPLEELMGKLLEENPRAASQLMGSRGLFMMPMAFAERLMQDV